MSQEHSPSLLFFTCATGIYKAFIIPYIYFAVKSNPNSIFEILVDSANVFEKENKEALRVLRITNEVLIRDVPHLMVQPKMQNSIRFIVEPKLCAEYVYIGDVDILITENILEVHRHVFENGLPYSNLVRAGTKKLTGLHFAKYTNQYPLPSLDDLIETHRNDEELLYAIMERKGQIYADEIYKNIVKTRPLCGLHMSLNRLPFFDHRLRVGWGITYRDMEKIFNICIASDFKVFLDVCDESSRLIFCNAVVLSQGVINLGTDMFNSISRQRGKTDETNNYHSSPQGVQHQQIFSRIFEKNSWGSSESFSGPSSTLARTVNVRQELPSLIAKYDVKTVLDAPCGDMNWMGTLLKTNVFSSYIGADVVAEIVALNSKKYSGYDNVSFLVLDITKDSLPDVDLMLCRDCLFHFSYADFDKFIQNFAKSDIKFLLTTSHLNHENFTNKDITTGGWKWMDLFLPPYSMPQPIYRFNDGLDRELCLWTREQIVSYGKGRWEAIF